MNSQKLLEPLRIIWEHYKDDQAQQTIMVNMMAQLYHIAHLVENILPRDGGIKDANPDFPWLALQQLKKLPQELAVDLFETAVVDFLQDIDELEQRVNEIITVEKLKYPMLETKSDAKSMINTANLHFFKTMAKKYQLQDESYDVEYYAKVAKLINKFIHVGWSQIARIA